MILLPNIRVACLTFALVVVAGCQAKRSPNVRQQSPLTPVAQEIERRGYHAKESLIVVPTAWDISTFRMRGKQRFSFRADQPQSGSRDLFCRFSFFEETYDSVEDARHRLANLHLPSPDTSEENEYERVMRHGFRVGKVVYVLQTDAIIFWDEVRRFAKELANAVQGVDLTRVMIETPVDHASGGAWRLSGKG